MGYIDHTLVRAIEGALDQADETTIILRLNECYSNKHKQDLERLGMEIDAASGTIVTGNVPVGKIRDVSRLSYVLAIQPPTKQHLSTNP